MRVSIRRQYPIGDIEKAGFADLAKARLVEKLERERARVDAVVEALVSGKATEGADARTTRAIAIAAKLGVVVSAATRPRVSHLILERERLRLETEWMKRAVAAQEERLRLEKRYLDALVTETAIESEARGALDLARGDGCVQQSLVRDFERAQQSSDAKVRRCAEWIGRALAGYANSWSAARTVQAELEFRILGIRHGMALDRSELALAQWETLVGTPLRQMVALYAAGLTPDEIARFLHALANAAGLTFIGVGVQ